MMREDDPRLAGNAALQALILQGDAGDQGAEAQARLRFWQEVTAGAVAPDAAHELALARLILDLRGQYSAAELRPYRMPMLAQAGQALRGHDKLRGNGPDQAEVQLQSQTQPFRGFFGVSQLAVQHSLYAGGQSGTLRREVYLMADAVTVLPYDAKADAVLLVEQFRPGPYLRQEPRPWQVEAIAGRIDAGESPEAAAKREAFEEAGITLDALMPIAEYYPSPGAITEYLYSYLALADLSQARPGLYGLPGEGEDIRSLRVDFAEAKAWIANGRIANGPLILSLLWLERERARLRAEVGTEVDAEADIGPS